MSTADLIVGLSALAAMAWVNWYFFLARRPAALAAAGADGVQEVEVRVKGGYEPAVAQRCLEIEAGRVPFAHFRHACCRRKRAALNKEG